MLIFYGLLNWNLYIELEGRNFFLFTPAVQKRLFVESSKWWWFMPFLVIISVFWTFRREDTNSIFEHLEGRKLISYWSPLQTSDLAPAGVERNPWWPLKLLQWTAGVEIRQCFWGAWRLKCLSNVYEGWNAEKCIWRLSFLTPLSTRNLHSKSVEFEPNFHRCFKICEKL